MPNALAEPLYERLVHSFPADQAYTQADWTETSMPSPVRHYLNHLLRHQREREARRLRRARTNWVNYDHPEMEEAVRSFFETVEDHAQVPQAEWKDTLRTATQRTTAHLVRPVPFLASFTFDEHDGPVPLSKVQWRMRFFGPYGYLHEAVQAFAKKQNREALERDEFERVLRRVDERMTDDFGATQWLDLLEPLFEMADRAGEPVRVPLSLLRTFFEEKNATPIVERLTTYDRAEEPDSVSPNTLRRLIDEAVQQDASSPQHDTPEPTPEFSPDAPLPDGPNSTQAPDTGSPSSGSTPPKATPLWKQFQQGRPRRNPTSDDDRESDPQPLWTRFQSGQSVLESTRTSADSPAEGSSSTQSSVPPDQDADLANLEQEVLGTARPLNRDLYIQKLFDGDVSAYRRVLERLRTTDSWSVASQIIARDIFRAHQVNIYSDPAVHFTNTVEATFRE